MFYYLMYLVAVTLRLEIISRPHDTERSRQPVLVISTDAPDVELFDYKRSEAVNYDISFGRDLRPVDEVVSLVSLIFFGRQLI